MAIALGWGHGKASYYERLKEASGDRPPDEFGLGKEFTMNVSHYSLTLTNADLQLPERDKDWHRLLNVNLRETVNKNKRQRAPDKVEKRKGKRRDDRDTKGPPWWWKTSAAAGAFAGQWTGAASEDTCPVQQSSVDTDGSWANLVIGILCVMGVLGFLKVLYDMLCAYWELCVNQAAVKLCRSRCSGSAADESLGQIPVLERINGHEDDQCSLKDADLPRVSQGLPVAASVARQPVHVPEGPMYVPESSTSTWGTQVDRNGECALPQEVYLFPSGEVYHTEKTCSHVIANSRRPLTRRACTKCLDITQRRSSRSTTTQRSEIG